MSDGYAGTTKHWIEENAQGIDENSEVWAGTTEHYIEENARGIDEMSDETAISSHQKPLRMGDAFLLDEKAADVILRGSLSPRQCC